MANLFSRCSLKMKISRLGNDPYLKETEDFSLLFNKQAGVIEASIESLYGGKPLDKNSHTKNSTQK